MAISVNEKHKFGQHTIELFDKASNRYAAIIREPDGTIKETGDPSLIRIFKTKRLKY